MNEAEQENPLPPNPEKTAEEKQEAGPEEQPEEIPHSFDDIEHPQESRRFLYLSIILISLCVIGFGLLVRSQNLSIASLTDSIAAVSSSVRDLAQQRRAAITPTGEKVYRMANVASDNCDEQGGQLAIAKRPDGGEYGLCLFGPDRQCEEWALLDGRCAEGGVDISQFGHPADVYCAVTGNEVIGSFIPGKAGKCKVNGVTCPSTVFYETGECLSGNN